jgi:hypothetical protein
MGLASAAMLGVIWFALRGLAGSGALWQAVAGGLAGGVVYLLISWLLRVAEIEQFWGYGRRLLKRA